MRSLRDLIDCQEDNREISCFQEGNEMGSLDLIDCQEGRTENSNFQVGNKMDPNLIEVRRNPICKSLR
jgi:hypothetical protein